MCAFGLWSSLSPLFSCLSSLVGSVSLATSQLILFLKTTLRAVVHSWTFPTEQCLLLAPYCPCALLAQGCWVLPTPCIFPVVVPSAATLIIVVCVGFLVLMVVLGLVRIHSLHRRVSGTGGPSAASTDPKDPDLFWDDSALTIIVNPMEVSGVRGARL